MQREERSVRRPALSVRLRGRDRGPAVVLRVHISERVALVAVASTALIAAAVLCASDTPPTVGGLSIVGVGVLALALALVARIVRV